MGPGQPCFIIAEAGVNHNGSLEAAIELVDVAVQAGADAVKFQTFKTENLATPNAPKAGYQLQTTDVTESQFQMLKRLELDLGAHQKLHQHCASKAILFMSTPFDTESADLLSALDLPVFKTPSSEMTNLEFLAHVARKRKPMIVSTGMASLGEVEAAVMTIRSQGNDQIALLHCVSAYPAEPAEVNLRAMSTLEAAFGTPVGFSDHTPDIEVAIAAVALGATIIEKHFTLSKSLPGPDQRASLEPGELANLVRAVRNTEVALGDGHKRPAAHEQETAAALRRSLIAAVDIPKGTTVTEPMIAAKRPGTGLPPQLRSAIIGRSVRVDVSAGTLLAWEMLT